MIKYHEKPRSWSAAFARWVKAGGGPKCVGCGRVTHSTMGRLNGEHVPMLYSCALAGGYLD